MKYMGSKSRITKYIIPVIQKYIDMNNITTYIEPFCLSKDTIVFTDTGIKTIEEINIGDRIIGDNGQYTTVVNKVKSNDKIGKYVKVKGNADFKATNNHIFYVNGKETKTSELKEGDILDIGHSLNENIDMIDMADYITISKSPRKGRSGKLIDIDKIKLYHNAPIINRFIPITKELMMCYGLIVAEGDKSNLTMHKSEINILKEFIHNYDNILGIKENNKRFSINENRHSCQLSVPYKTIYDKLFFQAMNIKYGARNKNISFLFSVSKEMCLEAIRYMYIGDGSCTKKGKYRSLNYKTSSKTLAYQLQTLLAIKFSIKSTLSYGINKERTIDGRTLKSTDYYNISVTRDEDIEFLTQQKNDNINIHERTDKFKITKITEIEDEFYDITIDNDSHKFIIAGGIVTHNCGGCNVIDKIKCVRKIGSDKNKYLIALLNHVKNRLPLYDEVNKELYNQARIAYNKNNTVDFEDWQIGCIGFLASYNGRWFDGGYAKSGYEHTKNGLRYRDYYNESKRNLLKQSEDLMNCEFYAMDYTTYTYLPYLHNCVIYCDPPYQNTKTYANAKDFDYTLFWDTVRNWSKTNIVIVSEENAPDDFICIWEQTVSRSILVNNKSKSVEKLFIWKDGVANNVKE